MGEKLLLKTTLYDELKKIDSELFKLYESRNMKYADLKVIETKISCLLQHKKCIESLIQICVDRNKF